MGTRSGTNIPVVSSVFCAVPDISGGVWNWAEVSKQADAPENNPVALQCCRKGVLGMATQSSQLISGEVKYP
jgi:hypothetical protein